MLTNNLAKFIKSLQLKKYRQKEGCFLVEGEKNVLELLHSSFTIKHLLATDSFVTKHREILAQKEIDPLFISEKKLSQIGAFKTNNSCLAVVNSKESKQELKKGLILVLDDIKDPGNLGTIIRTADWYGISQIIVSENTADQYNPKVIAASMGSLFRVEIIRTAVAALLQENKRKAYGASLSGNNIYKQEFEKDVFIVIGSESHGISKEVQAQLNSQIKIPKRGQAESLNAAVATAIICDNYFRMK